MFKLYLIATIACCFGIGRFASCISKHKWLRRLFYIIAMSGIIWSNFEINYIIDKLPPNDDNFMMILACYFGYIFVLIILLYCWVEYLKKKGEKNKI